MGCRFTIDGKTYEEDDFKSYLKAMEPAKAAKYMPGVKSMPSMPMEKTWHELALKRLLRYAAENGYARISWDTGDTNAARYDLSKQVDSLLYKKNADGTYRLSAQAQNRGHLLGEKIPEAELENHVGKDVAKRIAEGAGDDRNLGANNQPRDMWKELSGDGLKVGGEGMKGFYDKILPATVNKLAKKWGAKVEPSTVGKGGEPGQEYRGPEPTPDQIKEVQTAVRARGQVWDSPITGERQMFVVNRVANLEVDRVADAVARGDSFADAMREYGSPSIARIFGGDMVATKTPMKGELVHSVPITDAMREGVMAGQPLFSRNEPEASAYSEGGVQFSFTPKFDEAREKIAPVLRSRLNKMGLSDIALKLPDAIRDDVATADGMYYRRAISVAMDSADPEHVLNHEAIHALKRIGLFDDPDWKILSKKADSRWLDKFDIAKRYGDLPADTQREEAIAEAFAHWKDGTLEQPGNAVQRAFRKVQDFFEATRNALHGLGFKTADDIFNKIDQGEIGTRTEPEGAPAEQPAFARREDEDETPIPKREGIFNRILGGKTEELGDKISTAAAKIVPESISEAKDAIKMALAPMATGTPEARAAAKDFANGMRMARMIGGRQLDYLGKNFDHTQLERMWTAADEQSVTLQKGEKTSGIGLDRLTPDERKAVEAYQAESNSVLRRAQSIGLFKGEGLPSYVPRMVVAIGADGEASRLGYGGERANGLDAIGRNLKTSSPNLRQREYLTTEETEAAAKHISPDAVVVKDFRTLPLAMSRLNEAIAGRELINTIRDIGKATGDLTVSEGAEPQATEHKWFTIDHPAFKTYRPKMVENTDTGKYEALQDENGKTVLEKVPLFVRGDFEGPLRAVLSQDQSKIYKAFMNLKAKTMSVIMYSPMMHNAVIWGKAFPAAPRKLLTPWYRGADGKLRPGIQLYGEGRNAKNDPNVMKEAVSNGLDPIGHRYFNQDITGMLEQDNIAPGRSWTAKVLASVPGLFDKEYGDKVKRAVDKAGDVWHNNMLWDLVGDLQMGLYSHMRDQAIKEGADPQTAGRYAAHFANRYAGALPIESMSKIARQMSNFMLFSRSFTLTNAGAFKDLVRGLPQDVQSQILRDKGVDALNRIQGTARRKAASLLMMDIFLSHAGTFMAQYALAYYMGRHFTPPSQNEPDKKNRFLISYQKDGTAVYGRLPTGKVGEDLQSWISEPAGIGERKLSPYGRLLYGLAANDQGFGRKIYDPNDDKDVGGWLHNAARIAEYTAESVAPFSAFQGMKDLAQGKGEEKTNLMKTLLPLVGITVSKGAPGGPALGQLYDSKDEHEFQVGEAMPDIRDKIANGDIAGAQKEMSALGMDKSYQRFVIRSTQNPASRLSKSQMKKFMGYASPEDKAQMQSLQQQQKQDNDTQDDDTVQPRVPLDQHSDLEPGDLKGALMNGALPQFASSGATWSRQDAINAAQQAGMPATAALLREARDPVRSDLLKKFSGEIRAA